MHQHRKDVERQAERHEVHAGDRSFSGASDEGHEREHEKDDLYGHAGGAARLGPWAGAGRGPTWALGTADSPRYGPTSLRLYGVGPRPNPLYRANCFASTSVARRTREGVR